MVRSRLAVAARHRRVRRVHYDRCGGSDAAELVDDLAGLVNRKTAARVRSDSPASSVGHLPARPFSRAPSRPAHIIACTSTTPSDWSAVSSGCSLELLLDPVERVLREADGVGFPDRPRMCVPGSAPSAPVRATTPELLQLPDTWNVTLIVAGALSLKSPVICVTIAMACLERNRPPAAAASQPCRYASRSSIERRLRRSEYTDDRA